MNGKKAILLILALIHLVACQRAEHPESRTGLDNDSRSYSYVSFPETNMRQAAMTVSGVKDVVIKYDGQQINVYVVPKRQMDPGDYDKMEAEVRRKVNAVAPYNPFKVRIVNGEDLFIQETE